QRLGAAILRARVPEQRNGATRYRRNGNRPTSRARPSDGAGFPRLRLRGHRPTRRRVEVTSDFGRNRKETLRLAHLPCLRLRWTRRQGQGVGVAGESLPGTLGLAGVVSQ